MKFGALLTALMIFFSALALALPDSSEAARMGGGRSFGGRPSMSVPAKRPAMNNASPTAQRSAAATAQKPGMFGGMGGIFGGLLAGTLLGSLLSGNGLGAGGGFMDILLLGILAFIAYKLFMRFRTRQARPAENGPAGAFGGAASAANPFGNDGGFANSLQREDTSAQGWNSFGGQQDGGSSQFAAQNSMNVPPDFNVEEFLRGAKMVYNRMQKSWDRRDLADISQFVTPAVLNVLKEQAAEDQNPSNTEIMLVNARLVDVEREGNEERGQVYFDVTMRESPTQQSPEQVREIWHFVRVGADGEWKLDGIQQVD